MSNSRCHHLLDALGGYLDGEVSDALCAEIETHLATCEDCRVVVDTTRKTIELYRTLPKPEPPAGMRRRLYKALDLDDYLT